MLLIFVIPPTSILRFWNKYPQFTNHVCLKMMGVLPKLPAQHAQRGKVSLLTGMPLEESDATNPHQPIRLRVPPEILGVNADLRSLPTSRTELVQPGILLTVEFLHQLSVNVVQLKVEST